MKSFEHFVEEKKTQQHHGILLVSSYFSQNLLRYSHLQKISENFCGFTFQEGPADNPLQQAQSHPDLFIADRERKNLRLEDIKPIRNFSLYPPQTASKRLFVIENCERLNVHASNSLLKILEEPSIQCLFLLTTPKVSLVLPTIASRLQKVALAFPQEESLQTIPTLSPEDAQWLGTQINKFKIENYHPSAQLGLTKFSAQSKTKLEEMSLSQLISRCDKISKEYEVEIIRAFFIEKLSKKVKENPPFISTARLFLSHLSDWKDQEGYHPSTSLWLTRLLLLFL